MIFKNWINRTFGSTGALTGSDIPYDESNSVSEQIDDITNTRATQAEVDAGTNPNKFVTPLTLETKPKDIGELKVHAFILFSANGGTIAELDAEGISVVRGSTGVFNFTMTSPTPNTNYIITSTCGDVVGGNVTTLNDISLGTPRTTTTFTLTARNNNSTLKDCGVSSVIVSVRS